MQTADVVPLMRRAPRSQRTKMDTMLLDGQIIGKWRAPFFQRGLKINQKLLDIAEEIKHNGAVIPGVITLGVIEEGKPNAGTYLLDGQHRMEAFRISELEESIADVRVCQFDTMADMGEAFVELNSKIVTMRPDDVLRGLEGSLEVLRYLRRNCDFLGYDQIRRGKSSPILSMSMVLRCWNASAHETPALHAASAMHLAQEMEHDGAVRLADFLLMAEHAWGREIEYARLWGTLNLTMCMWLFRKLVLNTERGTKRYVVLKADQFKKCLMSISAAADYGDWLQGRRLSERDRVPCYNRLKAIFTKRLQEDTGGTRILMPSPDWAVH